MDTVHQEIWDAAVYMGNRVPNGTDSIFHPHFHHTMSSQHAQSIVSTDGSGFMTGTRPLRDAGDEEACATSKGLNVVDAPPRCNSSLSSRFPMFPMTQRPKSPLTAIEARIIGKHSFTHPFRQPRVHRIRVDDTHTPRGHPPTRAALAGGNATGESRKQHPTFVPVNVNRHARQPPRASGRRDRTTGAGTSRTLSGRLLIKPWSPPQSPHTPTAVLAPSPPPEVWEKNNNIFCVSMNILYYN